MQDGWGSDHDNIHVQFPNKANAIICNLEVYTYPNTPSSGHPKPVLRHRFGKQTRTPSHKQVLEPFVSNCDYCYLIYKCPCSSSKFPCQGGPHPWEGSPCCPSYCLHQLKARTSIVNTSVCMQIGLHIFAYVKIQTWR